MTSNTLVSILTSEQRHYSVFSTIITCLIAINHTIITLTESIYYCSKLLCKVVYEPIKIAIRPFGNIGKVSRIVTYCITYTSFIS